MKRISILFALVFTAVWALAQDWEPMASLPGGASDARHHPVTFSIDGYGYVVTGATEFQATNDFYRYDPQTDEWEELPPFPGTPRGYAYGTSRGEKAYVGFGADNNFEGLNDLWEYDSATEEWTELATCPCAGRYHPAFVQLGEKIYVGMGNNNSGNRRDWWEYDIATDTWEQKDDLPGNPRHHPFYFGIDSLAYVGFGHGNIGNPNIYNDFYRYDPATSEWTQMNDFPGEGRVAGTQFDYGGKGYVLSGDGDDHSFMEEGEFWEYDPELDEWTQLTSHPGSSRWAPGSFVIDNYAYLMCGLSDVQLESDLMRFEVGSPPSSTDEFSAKPILVSPNPATDVLSFSEPIEHFDHVRLVDGLGRMVRTVFSNTINIAPLPNGIYYLQFFENESLRSEKVIILK